MGKEFRKILHQKLFKIAKYYHVYLYMHRKMKNKLAWASDFYLFVNFFKINLIYFIIRKKLKHLLRVNEVK